MQVCFSLFKKNDNNYSRPLPHPFFQNCRMAIPKASSRAKAKAKARARARARIRAKARAKEFLRVCHVKLVNVAKTCCTSMAGDLFAESLITEQVKMAMYLNITDQEKAEKLIDCVRTKVAIAPEKIHVFIKVLRRHGGEEVAMKLQDMLTVPAEPDLSEFPKSHQKLVDPVPTREQLARALQSPPVGREDIAQQVVPGLSKLPKSPQNLQKDSKLKVLLRCLHTCLLIITVLALVMILGIVVHILVSLCRNRLTTKQFLA